MITILSGVPGSGKSTYVNQLVDVSVCSADRFFHTGPNKEYIFDAKKLGPAHAQCLRDFVTHILRGDSIVVDNTNITAVEIAPYYSLALAYGHPVEIVTLMVKSEDLATCAVRNAHGVPYSSIERMARNLRDRKLPPYWNSRTIQATF